MVEKLISERYNVIVKEICNSLFSEVDDER